MTTDLACVALLSLIGLSASIGVTVTAEIELPPDLIAIEALPVSEPIAIGAGSFLKRAIRVRHSENDEALLTGI